MKDLLMTPDNAQKCHDGTKTQTRRLINPQPERGVICECPGGDHSFANFEMYKDMQTKWGWIPIGEKFHAPYSVGEEVYIKETHYRYGRWVINGLTKTRKQAWTFKATTDEVLFADNAPRKLYPNFSWQHVSNLKYSDWYKRPSLFLPADLARTVVTITDIQAQRVQDISEKDAKAEGLVHNAFWDMWESPLHPGSLIDWYKTAFKQLWDSIHGSGAWERNDFVWKYSFIRRKHENEVGRMVGRS